MKNLLNLFVCLSLLGAGAGMAAASTNETAFVKSYEKLTGEILKNFKEDEHVLWSMHASDRALQTTLWLRLLNQINRARDVNFDPQAPENRYYANVTPMGSIENPDMRRMSEQVVQGNHEKALRSLFEHKMKMLEERCTGSALQYINLAFAKTPSDAKELLGNVSIIGDAKRRAELEGKLSDYTKLLKTGG
jgi:hypothetical protein